MWFMRYSCKICSEAFFTRFEAREHVEGNQCTNCINCQKIFDDKEEVREHRLYHQRILQNRGVSDRFEYFENRASWYFESSSDEESSDSESDHPAR